MLDPSVDSPADHYVREADELKPTSPEGEYTSQVYDINEPRKRALRKRRFEELTSWIDCVLNEAQWQKDLSLAIEAALQASETDKALRLSQLAQALRGQAQKSRKALESYSPVPADRPSKCRCIGGDGAISPILESFSTVVEI
ncbi:MAG: hypothetical protein HY791_26835 [Deltaproteobacteria bacterium]|nr:hypothetical protein [Deltaproteobacteria bacterium]